MEKELLAMFFLLVFLKYVYFEFCEEEEQQC